MRKMLLATVAQTMAGNGVVLRVFIMDNPACFHSVLFWRRRMYDH